MILVHYHDHWLGLVLLLKVHLEALLKMSFVHAHHYVSFPNRVGTVLQLELALELEDVGPGEAMCEQALVAG